MSRGWPSISELRQGASPRVAAAIDAQLEARRRPVLPASLIDSARAAAAGPVMNKTELRYQQRLEAEGLKPRFAAFTLCITSGARRVRYTPDFLVVRAGELELHEVKGAHVYEDGALKFRFAVEQWGGEFTFVWAQWKHGAWTIRRHERRHT